MIGHVGGAPIEELLLPFLVTGGPALLLAARAALSRVTGRWSDPNDRDRSRR